MKKNLIPEGQLLLFQDPPYTVLHLHPKTDFYYVVDESVEEYVRLYGEPMGVRPYTRAEAREEAERRNALLGYHVGTYELRIRNSSFFRNKLAIPWDIEQALQSQHADIWYSNSGGKDSDAMTELLELLVRRRRWRGNRRIVHADTGVTEWLQTGAYVKRRADELRLPIIVVARPQGDLIAEMYARHQVRPDAPPFPSQQFRWCTSDQKTSQIHKPIRQLTPEGYAICAIGIRGQESPRRAKQPIWSLRSAAGCSTRTVYDWHPLHFFDEEAVWKALGVDLAELNALRQLTKSARDRGGNAIELVLSQGWKYHIAYPLGTKRMSCSCCFLARDEDVRIGAFYNPDAYRSIVTLEILSGFSYFPDRWLGTLCPQLLTEDMREQLAQVIERGQKQQCV